MAVEGGQNRFINRDFSPNETNAVFYVLRWLYELRETTVVFSISTLQILIWYFRCLHGILMYILIFLKKNNEILMKQRTSNVFHSHFSIKSAIFCSVRLQTFVSIIPFKISSDLCLFQKEEPINFPFSSVLCKLPGVNSQRIFSILR